MVSRKAKPSRKERRLAASILTRAGLQCRPMKCDDLTNCAALCKGFDCGTFSDVAGPAEPLPPPATLVAAWCPTQIKCSGHKCDKVKCDNLKVEPTPAPTPK